ncbi:MAG: hypothetical protein LBU27_09060 [Candidatus Peribacteria bacterium]|nr:hypothetical protein [Candidatus Peribacteria bacterium]
MRHQPTKEDRDAIKQFVNVVNALEWKDSSQTESPEHFLLEELMKKSEDMQTWVEEDWKKYLTEQGLSTKMKNMKQLQKIIQTFAIAYGTGTIDSLPLYKTVVEAIAYHGSIEATYTYFEKDIQEYRDNYKEQNKTEHKAEKLLKKEHQAFNSLATELGISKSNVYNLLHTKADFFENKSPEDILADFNFDNKLTFGDNKGTTRTGFQWKDVWETLRTNEEKNKALENVLAVAKNINATLPEGTKLPEDSITVANLTSGTEEGKKVLLLAQSVIRKP